MFGLSAMSGIRMDVMRGELAIRLSSPIRGVAPRRWVQVANAATAAHGRAAIRRALDPDEFPDLETEFGQPDLLTVCPHCGETVTRRGLANHERRSTRCCWVRAAREVRRAWELGWRDPYSLPAGTPLSWTELQRAARWRNRLRTVRFPRWTAVLLGALPQLSVEAAGTA